MRVTPSSRRRSVAGPLVVALALVMTLVPVSIAHADTEVDVIVRAVDGDVGDARRAVAEAGGRIELELPLVNGFAVTVAQSTLPDLAEHPAIASVTGDAELTSQAADHGAPSLERPTEDPVARLDAHQAQRSPDDEDLAEDEGDDDEDLWPSSLYSVVKKQIGADALWRDGHTGGGVDVALIDSGVAPVEGLRGPGKVTFGPNFSRRASGSADQVGHGTHLAGIIAGRDAEAPTPLTAPSKDVFTGVAPDAGIVSVKVADADGVTTMSRLIAGIGWVLDNAQTGGRNIRVINLSFNADFRGSYETDPLALALEHAWNQGLVVVTAAGNEGPDEPLDSPAWHPGILAVGASADNGTASPRDDSVAPWSSCGTDTRHADLVAPGTSILSLRAPGSQADVANPTSIVNDRFFLGSGTSQAAAVVSGAAALLIDQRPDLSPDQLRAVLLGSSRPLAGATARCQGAGMLDLGRATGAASPAAPTPPSADDDPETRPTSDRGTGEGPDADDRGARRGAVDPATRRLARHLLGRRLAHRLLTGDLSAREARAVTAHLLEHDLGRQLLDSLGSRWSGSRWSGSRWSGSRWSGSRWSGSRWSGSRWSGSRWSGSRWS